ncbi:MAG: VCBS repeat-containing protein [Planctomycetes bacterium]|nr:VCBS repeat-containing protein [Planctomycetota bacterium]
MSRPSGLAPLGPSCAAALAVLAACGDRGPEPAVPAGAPTPPESAPARLASVHPVRAPKTFLPGRVPRLPPWGEALRARLDGRRDGWPGESLAPRLAADLGRALEAALSPGADLGPLRALGTSELAFPRELLPAERDVLLEGPVRAASARTFPPAADLPAALAGVRAALAGTPRCEVSVETYEPAPGGRFEARIALRLSTAGSARAQVTLECDTTWVQSEGGARLARLEPRTATLVSVPTGWVRDATAGAIGSEAWFAADVLLGAPERHQLRDRLGLDPFLGMHGLAIGDVDGDGLEDVYVCQASGQPNRLLLHGPDGRARDAARAAGVAFLDGSSAALFADLDGDGDEDLVVATGNVLLLAWNDGAGRFPEGTVLAAPDAPEIYSIAAADVDLDGDLDLYACRYVEGGVIGGAPVPYHDARNGAKNVFWRNEGARRFRECAAEVGLDAGNDRFSLAAVFEDFDDDGDPDLYVTNDFGANNLYENRGGTFVDVAGPSGAIDVAAGMGAAVADVDLDGDLDLYVTNMESAAGSRLARSERFRPSRPAERAAYVRHARGNTLLVSTAPLRFEDRLETSGARRGGWAWGATFTDWNGDGLPDLFVPNGFVSGARRDDAESFFWRALVAASPDAPPPDAGYLQAWQFLRHLTLIDGWSWNGHERDDAYLNVGGGHFVDASRALGVDFESDGRAVARCDWDGDLAEDLWVGARTSPRLRLLLAGSADASRAVALELAGTRSQRQGVGATVFVESGGRTLRAAVRAGDGYLTSSSKRLLLRLPSGGQIDALRVRWPGGALEAFAGAEPGALWRLVEGTGRAEPRPIPRGRPPDVPSPWEPARTHGLGRIVLDDRLPAGALELPDLAGALRRVEHFAGRALLLSVGRAADPETAAHGATLDACRAALEAAGAATWTLVIPEPGREEAARALLATPGARGAGGLLDPRLATVLEVLLVEILGPFERIPLPLTLLLDRGGSIALLRVGPTAPEDLLADARAVVRLDPGERGTEALLGGGHWARKPERGLGALADVFQRLGRADLAGWYREAARTRPAR